MSARNWRPLKVTLKAQKDPKRLKNRNYRNN